MNNFQYRTVALAGVFRSAFLVDKLSHGKSVNESDITSCVNSIFCTSPDSPLDVTGSVDQLKDGLGCIVDQFGAETKNRNMDIARYVVSMLFLERRLSKNTSILDKLSTGVELASRQAEHFSPHHENVIANLADLYTKTISTLGPKIMVNGEEQYLSNPQTTNLVRTLLLAGIRNAVLWQQIGARRWHILFSRNRYVNEANDLLNSIKED